uniref:Uncharacterized protein n=1 Tax=Panagrolaimus sp. PS1159 TaxID=55785 RepID=A0AC35FEF7_9BILA
MFRSAKSENMPREIPPSSSPPDIPKLQMELLHEENEQKEKNPSDYYRLTEESVSTFIQELLIIMVSSDSRQLPENHLTQNKQIENLLPNSDRSYERPKRFLADLDHQTSQNLPPKSPRIIHDHHSYLQISYKFKVGFCFS